MSPRSPAGLWRRAGAAVLDRLVGGFAASTALMWLVLGLWSLGAWPRTTAGHVLLGVGLVGLALALHVAYQVVLVAGGGQTLGGMAVGIAVVTADGAPPGYARAAVRCLGGIVNATFLGLPSLPLLFLRPPRTLGDFLGGTRLVREPVEDA